MTAAHESPLARIYIGVVILCGGCALCYAAIQVYLAPPDRTWLLLAALTLLSGLFTIRVPSISATISVSETFIFTSVLLFGPNATTVVVAFEAMLMSFWRHRREARKVLFNATQPTLSIWLAANLFYLFLSEPLSTQPQNITSVIGPMLALAAAYFLLNSWLTATAVGLVSGIPIRRVWREHFAWLSLNYLVGASVALMIVQSVPTVGFTTLGIILPLLALSYFTMKSAMGRLDDANKHIAQVEKLYLSTVESLAMAVDAKDQVTHGHIRRVQQLAVGLATELGIKDVAVLRAIEAAALLHDMGKLAVPEYILNKPGKLTPSEFEKMKLHASVGAEILSSIDFPYPVVPIVRHHHENWDGGGYPDGISGAHIPIGARILAVVDCFDALTSDRPYRRRLPDDEAIDILLQRRGTMYDPLVVDRFVDTYSRIRPSEQPSSSETVYRVISQSTAEAESLTLNHSLPDRVAGDSAFESKTAFAMFEKYLAQLFPHTTCAIYAVDRNCEELNVISSTGPYKELLTGLKITIGDGVSGWVAANRRMALNSDPVLDFGHDRTRFFKYCASFPITSRERNTLGVITVYSDAGPISESDCDKLHEAAVVGSMMVALETAVAPSFTPQ